MTCYLLSFLHCSALHLRSRNLICLRLCAKGTMQNTWDIAHKSSQRTREAKVKYKNSQKHTAHKILQISYKIQSIKPNSLQRKQHCTTVSGNLIFLRQMHKCSLQFNRRYTMYDTSKQLKAAKHCTLHLPRMFEVSNIHTNKKKLAENYQQQKLKV